MKMKLTTHRGSNEIGGTCIELEHAATRIILDFGVPLTQPRGGEIDSGDLAHPTIGNGMLPDISSLYGDNPGIDAVLLSHAHLDHYGFMDKINHDIPIYMSVDAKAIIEAGNIFWRKEMRQEQLLEHSVIFNYWKSFKIGSMAITPYLVDHSAYGSAAFLIEADGNKVFYTGDFRAHGNKAKTYFKLLADEKLKHVDALIIEGTTLGSGHAGVLATENDVMRRMTDVFVSQQDISFVMASGSNIDRLVSLFKATKKAKKELIVDLYQYFLLKKLQGASPKSNMPPFKDDHLRIFYTSSQAEKLVKHIGKSILYEFHEKQIKKEEILEKRAHMVLRLSMFEMARIANLLRNDKTLDNANFIYSMWSGYLNKQDGFQKFSDEFGIPIQKIHASGHAYKKDLLRFVKALTPKKLVPVHTLKAFEFKKELNNVNVITEKQINL